MISWLELPAEARVFDLCCGMGRHSLALADAGYQVTGMDLSTVLLQEAQRLDSGGAVKWLKGDMRQIPLTETFAAVVNLFTSFGYFDEDAENVQVLQEMERLLRIDGKFIIDFLNPIYVEANLVLHSERQEGDLSIVEHRAIEAGYVRKRIAICELGQPERQYLEQIRLYHLADFERMLMSVGLQIDQVYGHYDSSPYNAQHSPRLIMVGSKKGNNPDAASGNCSG